VNPGQNATGQNATREVNGRTKCHCLILRESKDDSDENSPEDSQMSPHAGINVHAEPIRIIIIIIMLSADSLFSALVSNWQNVIHVCLLRGCLLSVETCRPEDLFDMYSAQVYF